MCYTEPPPAALAMTDGLDEDTVDSKPNYDGKDTEPVFYFTGTCWSTGRRGSLWHMATNCAPHNLV